MRATSWTIDLISRNAIDAKKCAFIIVAAAVPAEKISHPV
jgi:hypothetical protein